LATTNDLQADVHLDYAGRNYDWFARAIPFKNKTVAAAAFISNCGAKNDRLEVVDSLIKAGFPVHSYGKCLHNADTGGNSAAKLNTLRQHLFSLAFENSNVRGYVTEKYYQSLVAGSVPVYMGAPNIADFSPTPLASSSIVVVDDVTAGKSTPAAKARVLAARLWELAKDQSKYEAMLAWKTLSRSRETKQGKIELSGPLKGIVQRPGSNCRLCLAVREKIDHGLKNAPRSSVGVVKRLPASEQLMSRKAKFAR
jgi:glycoprotein 3-alpha-L-fucosyltransferase